jgi:hypothetical protein
MNAVFAHYSTERTCVTFPGTEQLTQLFESNSSWAEESYHMLSLISMTHGTLLTRVLKQGMTASHQHRTSVEIKSAITGACRMDVTSVSREGRNIQKRKK